LRIDDKGESGSDVKEVEIEVMVEGEVDLSVEV
jgi:hypothetical protein